MSSSPESDRTEVELAADGGVPFQQTGSADPLVIWVELMKVVEALSPRWPERHRITTGEFKL